MRKPASGSPGTVKRFGTGKVAARRGVVWACAGVVESKYGVDFRVIHHWVSKFQGKEVKKVKSKSKPNQDVPQEELPTDVNQLQEELRKAKLHNKLLNAIIDIAEEQLKIDIRKKSGTKQ